MRRLWAFLMAPFPAALIQAIVVGVWPKAGKGVFEHPASMFVVVCLYFYLFGLLLGLPVSILLKKRSLQDSKAYLLAGLVAGLLPVAVALAWSAGHDWASTYIVTYNLLFFGLGGVSAGWLYWNIAGCSAVESKPKPHIA